MVRSDDCAAGTWGARAAAGAGAGAGAWAGAGAGAWAWAGAGAAGAAAGLGCGGGYGPGAAGEAVLDVDPSSVRSGTKVLARSPPTAWGGTGREAPGLMARNTAVRSLSAGSSAA
ncbi:hypothetical protein DRB96_32595 [Streptomyces sp. ICC1]|nr:hypothetical protein DRB96_32595 [Streptomyces sp. ICC1]